MNTTTILALDLGTQTGWALACRDGSISSGSQSFKPQRFEGGGMRFLRFKRWLNDIKQCNDGIDQVVFEEVRRHVGVDAAHAYGGFMGQLTAWCEHHQIPYQGIPVGTIKKHATGKGNASKDEMVASVRARGHAPADDNEADAIALLYLAREMATEGCDMKVPQYRYRCPLGNLQPTTPDLDAVKREGWRTDHILVVSEHDERLDWVEKQFVRRLGERLYGNGGHGHD